MSHPSPEDLNKLADLLHCLESLKRAGWVAEFDLSMKDGRPTVRWTDHGRLRARQLVEIDTELDPGDGAWTILLAACRFLGPDEVQTRLN